MRILVVLLVVSSVAAASPKSNPAFLGITMMDVRNGVLVERVTKGSPAAEPRGLQRGDVIQSINGARIQNALEATAAITAIHPGDLIELDVQRNGVAAHVTVRLSTRSEVLYKRFGGRGMDPVEIAASDGNNYDLSALRGHATIVGWFSAGRCVDCVRVFNRIHDWIQRESKTTLALAITNDGPDAIASFKHTLDVPVARVSDELAGDQSLFNEVDRIQFMVLDSRGDVQFIAPIAPDADDLDTTLAELFAAAQQAQRPRR